MMHGTEELERQRDELQRVCDSLRSELDTSRRESVFLNLIMESLPYPFYVIRVSDYKITKANAAAGAQGADECCTCYAKTHNRSTPWSGDHPCPMEEIKKTGKPVIVEHIHQDENGNPIHVEISAFPVFDDNGSLSQIIEYSLDISRRKHAEQKREQVIRDLKSALSEIKQLSGLLPICSVCKKIRDDKGYWNQVETYISDHSEADFSHSFCPDCAHNLYGDLLNKKNG